MLATMLSLLLAAQPSGTAASDAKVSAAPQASSDEDVPSPADQARIEAQHQHYLRFTEQLSRSSSPRDWALASQAADLGEMLGSGKWNQHQGLLRKAAEAAPNDHIVQWLWARADDSVAGCDAARPCPERRLSVARLEPDNAAAWMLAFPPETADPDEIDRALQRMAGLDRYQDEVIELWQAWTEVYRNCPIPAQMKREASERTAAESDPESVAISMGISQAAMTGYPPQSIFHVCDRKRQPQAPASRFDACARIAALMLRQADTMLTERIASALQRSAALDPGVFAAQRRGQDWRMQQYLQVVVGSYSDPAEVRAFYRDLVATGSEIRAQELALTRAGIALEPPADWKAPDPGY